MRTYGGAHIDYCKNLGINPIFMSYSEIYEALDRGTVDGNETCVLQLSDALKHYEVVTQCTDTKGGFVTGGASMALNLKTWKDMPKDIQDILTQLNYDLAEHWAESLYKVEAKIRNKWSKLGIKMGDLSPKNFEVSKKAGHKAQKRSMGRLESKGQPAEKV
jgi:TRAP-type C4-dicarboxylate transport system substrate-binding protein